MCQTITAHAHACLTSFKTSFGNFSYLHLSKEMSLSVTARDDTRSLYVFSHVSSYIRQFIEMVDSLSSRDVQVVSCENVGRPE
jgi:hypothetical protein